MFNFIKQSLQKIYHNISSKFSGLFGQATINETTLKELELILIQADTGAQTTRQIIQKLKDQHQNGIISKGSDLKKALHDLLVTIVNKPIINQNPDIILLVGINGSGKTTTAAKIAYQAQQMKKRVLFVAADTFRAAAPEQLNVWATLTGASIELGKAGQDPASVVFTGAERFKTEQFDLLIIDTAGRLQTKHNLMQELAKIKRILNKQLPDKTIATFLTVDAMLGQNSFEQAKLFHESTDLSGIILTKMDGTGKGGIVFGIVDQLQIPISHISYGETMQDYKTFDALAYVDQLLEC